MRAYYVLDGNEYELKPMERAEFIAAFGSEHEGAVTLKALTGYPAFYVPGSKLVWPFPPHGLDIIREE